MSDRERGAEGGSIKVVDRRRFTADGDLKAEAAALEDPSKPKVTAEAQSAAEKARAAARRPAPAPGATPARSDFLNFIAQLATTAMASLGVLPEAQSRGMPVNPALAREYIDIIGMLEERTRGNLTPEEESTLGRILSELRLQYVEVTRAAQAAAGQAVPGGAGMRPPGR